MSQMAITTQRSDTKRMVAASDHHKLNPERMLTEVSMTLNG